MTILLVLIAALLMLTLALPQASRRATPPRATKGRTPARSRTRNYSTNHPAPRRRRPLTLTPGLLPGYVRPSRKTSCVRCHGPILAGEDCHRPANRRGLICPGCYLH